MFTCHSIDTGSNCKIDSKDTTMLDQWPISLYRSDFPICTADPITGSETSSSVALTWHHFFLMVYYLLINQYHFNIPTKQSLLSYYKSPIQVLCNLLLSKWEVFWIRTEWKFLLICEPLCQKQLNYCSALWNIHGFKDKMFQNHILSKYRPAAWNEKQSAATPWLSKGTDWGPQVVKYRLCNI